MAGHLDLLIYYFTIIVGVLILRKSLFATVSLLLAICINLSACATPHETSSITSSTSNSASSSEPSSINSSHTDSSSPYTIKDVVKPNINDRSSSYRTSELTALNKKNISSIYFLDDENFIFSAKNGKTDEENTDHEYDLYKYNLTTDTLTRICEGVMLYIDNTVKVKDSDNFSIISNGSYSKIENNKLTQSRNFRNEGKDKNLSICDAFYNEESGKLLFTEADASGNTTAAYVSGADFSSPEKLPFSGIYRVQWVDSNHVLVAYKDGEKSVLAKYGLDDKSTILTTLPENNFFLDPLICDNGLIEFLYLEPQNMEHPRGLLNTNDGTISRVYFDSCNPESQPRNGRIAAFTDSDEEKQLYLYNTADNTSTIRGKAQGYPSSVAVSPDGKTIVFFCTDFSGSRKSYINK